MYFEKKKINANGRLSHHRFNTGYANRRNDMRLLNDYERREAVALLDKGTWTHTITLSSFGDDVTVGKIFLQVKEGCERLLRNDPDALFVFYVCKNNDNGREHAHGVLNTSLPHIRIEGNYRGGRSKIFKSQPDIAGWYSYIVKQALQETLITNTQESFV